MNKIFKGVMLSACVLGSAGMLSACGKDNKILPEKYTLIFDADNNVETLNEKIVIKKSDLNNKSLYPTLESQNGYAGEWIKKSQDGKKITFISNYGDGSKNDPYLIENIEQFQNMIKSSHYSDQDVFKTIYMDSKYNIVEDYSQKAERKIVRYGNVDVVYIKASIFDPNTNSSKIGWALSSTVARDKSYFRLINDIDFSTQENSVIGGNVSIDLDGTEYDINGNKIGKYSLNYLSSNKFVSSNHNSTNNEIEGIMFEGITDSSFRNLEINLDENCATIAYMANSGTNRFENIVINSINDYVQMSNNDSVFVNFLRANCNLEMENVVNNANYKGKAGGYFGVFVGGSGYYGTNATFKNCVNNGNITTPGAAALFFGNSTYKSTNITIENCVNNGKIVADERSHILVPKVDSSITGEDKFTAETIDDYDETVAGKFTQNGSISYIQTNSEIKIVGNDVIITSKNDNNLTAGTYELVLSLTFKGTGDGYYTTRQYLPIKSIEVDGTEKSLTVKDVCYDIVSLSTFNIGGYSVDSDAIWNNIEGTDYKWTFDETTKCYVIDFNDEYVNNKDSLMNLDVTVKNSQGEILEIVTKPYIKYPVEVTIENEDITITKNENLTAGSYKVVLKHSFFLNSNQNEVVIVSIPSKVVEVDGTSNSFKIEDAIYDMVSLSTYNDMLGKQIDDMAPWKNIEGTDYKWIFIAADNCFVVDLGEVYYSSSLSVLGLEINVKDAQGNVVEIFSKPFCF